MVLEFINDASSIENREITPIHINKTSTILKDEYGIDEPIIAYAYIKFDPVPPKWEHLLENNNALEEDKNLLLLSKALEVSSGIMQIRSGGNVRSKMISREGSLVNLIIFIGLIANFFKPEIKEWLRRVYNDESATAIEVREVVKAMFELIYSWNKLVKQSSKMLNTTIREIIEAGIDPDDYNIRAEARMGILGNLEKFQDSFSASKSGSSIESRIKSLKRALIQLETITANMTEPDDKELIHMYLSIRTRGTLFIDNEEYDELMRQVCDIRDSLKKEELF